MSLAAAFSGAPDSTAVRAGAEAALADLDALAARVLAEPGLAGLKDSLRQLQDLDPPL